MQKSNTIHAGGDPTLSTLQRPIGEVAGDDGVHRQHCLHVRYTRNLLHEEDGGGEEGGGGTVHVLAGRSGVLSRL